MPKNHNTNIYQTTAFDQYPSAQRTELIEKRKHIIDLRLRAQSHFNYPEVADNLWKQSDMEAKTLQKWIDHNPAPKLSLKPKLNPFSKLARLVNILSFRYQYAK